MAKVAIKSEKPTPFGGIFPIFFGQIEQKGLTTNRFRADCGSCPEAIVNEAWKHCKTFYIRANRYGTLPAYLFSTTR